MRGSSPRDFSSILKSAPTFFKKRIPKLTKVINLDIDFQSTQPLYCEFMRADKLEFNISYSDSAYPENASKLRVFCYMKNGGYAFGDEFEDVNSAIFDSNRTSKYSGYGTITIQLLDAEENLINSANVVCKIIESNSTTPFVVSPDFTEASKLEVQAIVDDGKAQIVEATNEAKEKIDGWTDQSSRIAKNESNITDLQLFKSNTGALHFNGGNVQCPKLLKKQQFSFAVRIKANKNDVLIGKQVNIIDAGVFYLYIHSSVQRLSVYATRNSLKSVTVEQNDRIFDGNWHSLFVIYDGTTLTLLDEFGVLLTANYSIQEQTSNTKIGANFVGEMSDVCLFNFDITSEDALYTIADYQQGKPIPPSALENTILALENYTIINGNSKFVFDYSGNNNDATITGNVKGDNDNRVQKLTDYIKSFIKS